MWPVNPRAAPRPLSRAPVRDVRPSDFTTGTDGPQSWAVALPATCFALLASFIVALRRTGPARPHPLTSFLLLGTSSHTDPRHEPLVPRRQLEDDGSEVLQVALSFGGSLAAAASASGAICIWNTTTGQLVHRLEGHTGAVRGLSLSADATLLLSGSDDETVRLWHLETGAVVKVFPAFSAVNCVAFSPDRSLAACGCDDASVRLWDLAAGNGLSALSGHSASVWTVAFAPTGRQLASGCDTGDVRFWDVSTLPAKATSAINGCPSAVLALAYAPRGDRLAGGLFDGSLLVWDLRAGVERLRLDDVTAFAWLPGGEALVVSGEGDALRLAASTTGEVLTEFRGFESPVSALAVAGDGRTLIAADSAGRVHVWDIPVLQQPAQGSAGGLSRTGKAIVIPDASAYPSFDRSNLTDDAIRLVKEHVAAHGNLDLAPERLAMRMRDFEGKRSTESIRIAREVLTVWKKANAPIQGIASSGPVTLSPPPPPLPPLLDVVLDPEAHRGDAADLPPHLIIDVWCDFGCPTCYIGMCYLWRAVKNFQSKRIALVYHPCSWDDALPEAGFSFEEFMEIRWGSVDRARLMRQAAATAGIGMQQWAFVPHTALAHRLVQYAQRHGRADAVVKALFQAVFEAGLNLDLAVVIGIGEHLGLPGVASYLRSGQGAADVAQAIEDALEDGGGAVPQFRLPGNAPYYGPLTVVQWNEVLARTLTRQPAPAAAAAPRGGRQPA